MLDPLGGSRSRKRGAGAMEAGASTSGRDPWATTSFRWRIEDFSKLSKEAVKSDCFEAGIATWRLEVSPRGDAIGAGTHLSVYLEAFTSFWEPDAEIKITLINQADASKSHSFVDDKFFDTANTWSGDWEFFELSALKDKAAGWLVNDTLVLTVDVTVTREDRFQLVTGGAPCDMILRLPCGVEVLVLWEFLQVASPFFRNALEDVNGSNVIPLDGSFGTWTYILTYLYPLHDRPELTLESIYALLPVVHKYDFTRLLTRLVAFVKESGQLDHWHYECATYVINWLALAERLQLDELRELCLGRLRCMTKDDSKAALTVEVEVGSGAGMVKKCVFRVQVEGLGQALCLDLLDIALE
ncbi:hypothetical protein FOA52_003285 [Chlamydomonas sp. UWO 241]|nr:hypothetical protein FOA52_003285 [Chlamydomonas sp. UWO 241]